MHEPKTECIAKSKVRKCCESGMKAGLETSAQSNWFLGVQVFSGTPCGGHARQAGLEQAARICGVPPKQACLDLGCCTSSCKGPCDIQVVHQFRKTRERSLLRWWKQRSTIGPVIEHVREDHFWKALCRPARARGDALQTILTAVGGGNLSNLTKGTKRLFFALLTENIQSRVPGRRLRDSFLPSIHIRSSILIKMVFV